MATRGADMKTICLHGPESTGKSTLATQLAAHLGCEIVPEYGRAYCEQHGTDIDMAALLHIAQTQARMNRAARDRGGEWLILDTDPLVTIVWAEMMFGARDPGFASFAGDADLYLLLDIDLPFVDDGLRVYAGAAERARFFALCQRELENHKVNWALVSGARDARLANALARIKERLA